MDKRPQEEDAFLLQSHDFLVALNKGLQGALDSIARKERLHRRAMLLTLGISVILSVSITVAVVTLFLQ